MSEGIWVYVFMIFCGMWMALIFVMIGVLIEGVRNNKNVLCGNPDLHDSVRDRDRAGNGNMG